VRQENGMEPSELKEIVDRGEGLHTDFKAALSSPDELAKDLVAFANTDGGRLVVGVADDRTVVGIPDLDAAQRLVDNVAFNNCDPPTTVLQETVAVDGRSVLVVRVPRGDQRPYRTSRGRYYIRTTSGCRDASRGELLRLFQAAESLHADELPVLRAGLADLSMEAFEQHLTDAGLQDTGLDRLTLLRNWRLVAGDHPTLAGLLLFGRRPQEALPWANVICAAWPGTDDADSDLVDRKDCDGRLTDVIETVLRFLHAYLREEHHIRGGTTPEAYPELHPQAVREAVVNAVAHRDYTVPAAVRVFVFRDRVDIRAPGRPPNSVDEAAMRAGTHVVRNPHLYARLGDLPMLVTKAGSGVRRMVKLVRETSGRELGIVLREHETVFSLPRKPYGELVVAGP